MNIPATTAVPHDDSKVLSAEKRAQFNYAFALVQRRAHEQGHNLVEAALQLIGTWPETYRPPAKWLAE